MFKRFSCLVILITALTLTVSACAPTQPATIPPQSKELTLVKGVRPAIASTVAALEKGDITAARAAWATYDPLWNGMEVYINYRSLPTYDDLEHNWQDKINKALASPDAKAADVLPLAQSLLAKWDEAIKLVQTGPPISPLFDDVADIRIARQPLRQIPAALTANDIPKAKSLFTTFTENWPKVNGLIKIRSLEAYNETEAAIATVKSALIKASSPTAAELTPLVATVTNRYNYGLSLVTTAARKADLSKTTFANEDVQAAGGIRAIQAELKASLTAWNAGKYSEAVVHSDRASKELFTSATVATPLKAKALDAALKTALDNYAAISGSAGDAAKASATNKTAIEAGEVAIQGLVGQFWSDPKLAPAIASATPK
ncbi:MAG: hypothetical protein HY529_00255 [Chloroflexi bacterium]|nr:hypothetical protein [Chloroflexota bacterium]